MMTRKAKQLNMIALGQFLAGLFVAQVYATDDGKVFLPIPGEVTATQHTLPSKPVITGTPVVKTNNPADFNTQMSEMRKRTTTSASQSDGDWPAYNHDRHTNVILDNKLVDKNTLTPLVGFLVKERATLSNGTQTFTGAALDIAERKSTTNKVTTAMELRPSLWRNTNERVFLLNYRPETLPGALLRVYVQEIAPLEGRRTFKVGIEPNFEDWKRLSGR